MFTIDSLFDILKDHINKEFLKQKEESEKLNTAYTKIGTAVGLNKFK